ncbi:MAG: LLM class flavin-dependent oxidoreductase [Actinomycetota bacterium]|nr:LLM class flavin-dependent oxidoreductase [Actinomycetota bacterium]
MADRVEVWTTRVADVHHIEATARRAEDAGWDGITLTDSQNLAPDPFVAATLAARATERLRLATGVTNAHTRHPAALATVAASVGEVSGGRFVLGIGRGDTALFHLGLSPMKVADFSDRVTDLQHYLAGDTVDCDGHPSRIRWLRRASAPKVPLDVAASGPKVISLAARVAERITFAVGADPERIEWALGLARKAAADAGRAEADLSFGAYVNVGAHPDIATARSLIAGGVAAFAHFSAMPGSTGAGLGEGDRDVVAEVGRRYDSNEHLRNDARHNEALESSFVDRFAVVGPPDRCVDRLHELVDLGLRRFVLTGPGLGASGDDARLANRLLTREVLPAVQRTG